jgi:hypothetical protein
MLYRNSRFGTTLLSRFGRSTSVRVTLAAIVALGVMPQLPAATTETATVFHIIKKVRESAATSTNSINWVNVPGATAVFPIPANHKDLWNARFTAESVCTGGAGWCSVRILLNGVEMDPVAGLDFAFDSTDGATEGAASWEARAMERSKVFATGAAAGVVTVQVQYAVTNAALTFRLDDWHLAVEAHH